MKAIELADKMDKYADDAIRRIMGQVKPDKSNFIIDALGGESVKSVIDDIKPTPHEPDFMSKYNKDSAKYNELVKLRNQIAYMSSTVKGMKNMFGAGPNSTPITDVDHFRQMTLGLVNMKSSLRQIKPEVSDD